MKHYTTLIKLKQREIDVLRKQQMNLAEQKSFLESMMQQLQHELEQEVMLAGDLLGLGVFFGDYSGSNKKKQEMVEEQIIAIDKQMAVIADKILLVYGEQKKFEIAKARKMEEIRQHQAKKEQQFMDEVAGNQWQWH